MHNSPHLEILKTDIPYDEVTVNKISKRHFQQRILDVPFDGVFVIRKAKGEEGPENIVNSNV